MLYAQDGAVVTRLDVNFFVNVALIMFLSQIGWTNNEGDFANKVIHMDKIYINIDTDGGNSTTNRLHSKMQHRSKIMEKIEEYLNS